MSHVPTPLPLGHCGSAAPRAEPRLAAAPSPPSPAHPYALGFGFHSAQAGGLCPVPCSPCVAQAALHLDYASPGTSCSSGSKNSGEAELWPPGTSAGPGGGSSLTQNLLHPPCPLPLMLTCSHVAAGVGLEPGVGQLGGVEPPPNPPLSLVEPTAASPVAPGVSEHRRLVMGS